MGCPFRIEIVSQACEIFSQGRREDVIRTVENQPGKEPACLLVAEGARRLDESSMSLHEFRKPGDEAHPVGAGKRKNVIACHWFAPP